MNCKFFTIGQTTSHTGFKHLYMDAGLFNNLINRWLCVLDMICMFACVYVCFVFCWQIDTNIAGHVAGLDRDASGPGSVCTMGSLQHLLHSG